jgi:hypothetical protein
MPRDKIEYPLKEQPVSDSRSEVLELDILLYLDFLLAYQKGILEVDVQKDNQFIVTRLEEEMLDVAKQYIYNGCMCFRSINLM